MRVGCAVAALVLALDVRPIFAEEVPVSEPSILRELDDNPADDYLDCKFKLLLMTVV